MTQSGPDWPAYLSGLAAFSGTLFALVLAARQIRGPVHENPPERVARAYLVDSVAVTAELGVAALLAVLATIEGSGLFSVAVVVVAAVGAALSVGSAVTWGLALRDVTGWWRTAGAWALLLGNVLPLACYTVAALYAVGHFRFDDATWGYAAALSWLTLSGTIQSVLWYARIWEKPSLSAVVDAPEA
jgi:hypothetical protein